MFSLKNGVYVVMSGMIMLKFRVDLQIFCADESSGFPGFHW